MFEDPAFDREHSPQDVDSVTQIVLLSESFKKRNLPILEQSCLFWQKRSTVLKRLPQCVKLETRHLYLTLGQAVRVESSLLRLSRRLLP